MTEPAAETLLDRLGGEPVVARWVEAFYDAVAADPLLRPLFPEDLTESREKQFAFFVEMLGGPRRYTDKYGPAFLRFKHRHVRIGRPERDAWMAHAMETLRAAAPDDRIVADIEAKIAPLADHMINHHPERKDAQYFN